MVRLAREVRRTTCGLPRGVTVDFADTAGVEDAGVVEASTAQTALAPTSIEPTMYHVSH